MSAVLRGVLLIACIAFAGRLCAETHLQESFVVPRKSSPVKSVRPAPVHTETAAPLGTAKVPEQSVPWSIVLGLTLLTVLPAILLAMTPMVRLLVVFHFLRQALGTQTAPSNQVLMGLALMMTWFLMQPVMTQVERDAVTPYQAGTLSMSDAFTRGSAPVKTYMLRYAREKDLAVFVRAGALARPKTREELRFLWWCRRTCSAS